MKIFDKIKKIGFTLEDLSYAFELLVVIVGLSMAVISSLVCLRKFNIGVGAISLITSTATLAMVVYYLVVEVKDLIEKWKDIRR